MDPTSQAHSRPSAYRPTCPACGGDVKRGSQFHLSECVRCGEVCDMRDGIVIRRGQPDASAHETPVEP